MIYQPPHERRYFVHKRLLGAAKSFVTSGFNPLAAVGGFVAGGRGAPPARRPPPRTTTARPSAFSAAEKEEGRKVKFGNGVAAAAKARCNIGFVLDAAGNCVRRGRELLDPLGLFGGPARPSGVPSVSAVSAPVGEAVMGRYGAGLVPGSKIVDRAVCLRGMQLGDDGLCYNKSQITNKERMWPRGRRPLLTGGDMRAISIASTAARRLTRTAVRLHEIGLIKKPIARKPPKKKTGH